MVSDEARRAECRGVLAALFAFGFWGLVPIYFKWVAAAPAVEIIAHRILWAIPLLMLFLRRRDGAGWWRRLALPPRQIAMLALTGALVGFNWLIFVYAVASDQILATSLGYYVNPLVNVLLGVVFLGERLDRLRGSAVLLAAAGVAYLGWSIHQPPWLALSLAFTFGLYGLLRKRLAVGPLLGLLWETMLLAPPAVAYLFWAQAAGRLAFLHTGPTLDALLLVAGAVTILPLIAFNVAAKRLPLSVLGFFQYLAPTISFLLAVAFYDEPFTRGHQVAFPLIWTALTLVSLRPFLQRRR